MIRCSHCSSLLFTPGYYLFVESSGRAPHDNARLISKQMSPTRPNKKCLKFFYHMFGPTTGSLSVTIYPISRKPKSLFWTSGSQGNEWKPAHVTIDSLLTYQVGKWLMFSLSYMHDLQARKHKTVNTNINTCAITSACLYLFILDNPISYLSWVQCYY